MISELQLISQIDLLHLRDPFNKSAYSCWADILISAILGLPVAILALIVTVVVAPFY